MRMESLSQAVSLARALLSLSRSRQTGVLYVETELGTCRVAVVEGVPRAASALAGVERSLGDALFAEGALDLDAHARAVEHDATAPGPIGDWLIAKGLASRGAVDVALRGQLRERLSRLFMCRKLEYRFARGAADAGVPWIDQPLGAEDVVLLALRERAASVPAARVARVVPRGELVLTASGRHLTARAALWPEESAAAALLLRGATLADVARATSDSLRALRVVALLALLAALREVRVREGDFALLLRKRAQLRGRGAAHALLDVPRDAAPAEARRALRRLAARVHPDRLDPALSPSLRRASSEVMSALIDAERTLRVQGPC
jgi:hypothetical protein